MIDWEKLNEAVAEDLKQEQYEMIKEDTKKVVRQSYYKKQKWRTLTQRVKCIFGRHLYNQIPSGDITTCACCMRVWNGMKGEPHA